jgi:uncharacterized membrane protein YbhN (UPF0104 family)
VTLSATEAHAIALALVVADIVARGLRLQWLLRGAGQRIPLWESVVVNAFGDAAAALTPLRIGGQPARFVGLLHAGVRGRTVLAVLAVEAVVTYGVVLVGGLVLALRFAPEWWAAAGPQLAAASRRLAPWIAGVVAVSIVVVLLVRPRSTRPKGGRGGPLAWLGGALGAARGIRAWPIAAAVPLSVVNVFGRVLVLPVLVLAAGSGAGFGAVTMGSFALLYSQLFLPTPSGAGAVELGFLAGAAGDLGEPQRRLLFFWRLYTAILPVAFGIAVSLPKYGRAAVMRVLRGEGAP